MKDWQRIKLRHTVDLCIEAIVGLSSGRPLVEVRPDSAFADAMYLTPTEARTLARALTRFAALADKKRGDHAR